MKKNYLTFLLTLIIFYSCSDDDNFNVGDEIDSYHFSYMHYPQDANGILLNENSIVHIQYENNKISKRDGGLVSASPTSGFNYAYSDLIYDDVTFGLNEIIIELKTYSSDEISLFKRTLKLDNQNRIIQKVIEKDIGYRITKDTIDFEYSSQGKLIKTSLRNLVSPKKSLYYYNRIENLDSIVTKEYILNPNTGLSLSKKIIETFENYDDSNNPTKELIIFEETFYRSLSKNNYSKYEKNIFNASNELIGSKYRIWEFVYDDQFSL